MSGLRNSRSGFALDGGWAAGGLSRGSASEHHQRSRAALTRPCGRPAPHRNPITSRKSLFTPIMIRWCEEGMQTPRYVVAGAGRPNGRRIPAFYGLRRNLASSKKLGELYQHRSERAYDPRRIAEFRHSNRRALIREAR